MSSTPIIELREYKINPQDIQTYITETSKKAELRKSLVPLRLFSLPETGGVLNIATHFYYYKDGFGGRDACRAKQSKNTEWVGYLKQARPYVFEQKSTILVEAPFLKKFPKVYGLEKESLKRSEDDESNKCIYEIRRYKLKL